MIRPSSNAPLRRLATVALTAAIFAGCSSKGSEAAAAVSAEPTTLPAEVEGVAKALEPAPPSTPASAADAAEVSGLLTATGEFISPVRSELVVRTPGRVGAVYADEGDRVHRGEPLLTLETQYLKPELARAEAELARAEANRGDAASDFERKEKLLAKNAIPQSLYDRSKAARDQAEAAVAAGAAAVALARQKLDDAVLTSPIDGVVAERRADVGERLGDNTVAFVLVQLRPLKLRFDLPERYLPAVHKGQPVAAKVDPFPGESFGGKLAMVNPVVDAASRSFTVEAEFPNRDGRLFPGLFARIELDAAPTAEQAP